MLAGLLITITCTMGHRTHSSAARERKIKNERRGAAQQLSFFSLSSQAHCTLLWTYWYRHNLQSRPGGMRSVGFLGNPSPVTHVNPTLVAKWPPSTCNLLVCTHAEGAPCGEEGMVLWRPSRGHPCKYLGLLAQGN